MTAPQTTRRAIMAGLAAAPVASLPAVACAASDPDPIFAAIERHATAEIRYCAACKLTDEVDAREEQRVITMEDHAEFAAAQQNSNEALDAFLATAPTSIAGTRAFLRHCIDQDSIEEFLSEALETLADSA
ncbi:MAG: hypothetical protein FJX48_00590 [Alphaproteobacteria bacterium]|nr:hypothetical protein [Alphaproteobacteria bacterium]